jgi:hypothetical protein
MASTEAALGTEDDDPIAEKTALGWACSGPILGCVVKTKFNSYMQTSLQVASESAKFFFRNSANQFQDEDDPHLGVLAQLQDENHIFHFEKNVESQSDVKKSRKSKPEPKCLGYNVRQTSEEWTQKKFYDQVSTPSQMETQQSTEKFDCMMPPQQSICQLFNLNKLKSADLPTKPIKQLQSLS